MDMVLYSWGIMRCFHIIIVQNHLKGGMVLRRRRCCPIWRRLNKACIGMILLAIGVMVIAIKILPVSVWIVLVGVMMIYIGYKLFCSY
jgi:uncharacterized membrane protein